MENGQLKPKSNSCLNEFDCAALCLVGREFNGLYYMWQCNDTNTAIIVEDVIEHLYIWKMAILNRNLLYTLMILTVLCFVGREYNSLVEDIESQWKGGRRQLQERHRQSSQLKNFTNKATVIRTKHKSLTKNVSGQAIGTTLSPKEVYKLGLKQLEELRNSMMTLPQPFHRKEWAQEYTAYKDTVIANWKHKLKAPTKHYKFAIGISTIKRRGVDYLFSTIHSLLENMRPEDEVAIVILVGEEDYIYSNIRRNEIVAEFNEEYSSGIIQVICPPVDFYPDWNVTLRQSFDDTFLRVKWRSKQNLDQMLLLTFVSIMNIDYYVMMEDDIIATRNYSQKMSEHVASLQNGEWLVVSYCTLGAIGKLLPKAIVSPLNIYIGLFWNDKPLDWLLPNYVESRICRPDKDCSKVDYAKYHKSYKPSLFQHVGKISSLQGKIQNLKDPTFGKNGKT